ncbi:MAG: hypothetical protein EBV03_06130 [Proteobacteria bacterium]|nr:hypothetical protein [Pseudomonadota bacterium]
MHERFDKDKPKYAEQYYREMAHLKTDDLPDTRQVAEDLELLRRMNGALDKKENPYHSMAVHHKLDLKRLNDDLQEELKPVKKRHFTAQVRGEETPLRNATPEGHARLQAARKNFVSNYVKQHGREPTQEDLSGVSAHVDERSLLTQDEQDKLREAGRIRTPQF